MADDSLAYKALACAHWWVILTLTSSGCGKRNILLTVQVACVSLSLDTFVVVLPWMFNVDPKSRKAWTVEVCAPMGNQSLRLSHFLKDGWPQKSFDLSLEILAPMS